MTIASAFLGWFAAHPILTIAGIFVVGWFIFDAAESAQGMDDDPYVEAEIQRRVAAGIAPVIDVQDYAQSICAQMIEDGLIRDPEITRTRAGE